MQSMMKTLLMVYGLLLFGGHTLYTQRPTAPVVNPLAVRDLKMRCEEEQWRLQKETPRAERAMNGDGHSYPIDEACEVVGKALHGWWTVLRKLPMPCLKTKEGFLILVGGACFLYFVCQILIWTKNHFTQTMHEVPKTGASDPDLYNIRHSCRRSNRMRRRKTCFICD